MDICDAHSWGIQSRTNYREKKEKKKGSNTATITDGIFLIKGV